MAAKGGERLCVLTANPFDSTATTTAPVMAAAVALVVASFSSKNFTCRGGVNVHLTFPLFVRLGAG